MCCRRWRTPRAGRVGTRAGGRPSATHRWPRRQPRASSRDDARADPRATPLGSRRHRRHPAQGPGAGRGRLSGCRAPAFHAISICCARGGSSARRHRATRLGYEPLADEHSWDFDITFDGAIVYESAAGVRIDLHWALLTEARYVWNQAEATGVWKRTVPITLAGERALGLAPEDLVLHLATHFAVHHSLTGLLRQWDLALVLAQTSVNWPRLWPALGPGVCGGRSSSRSSRSRPPSRRRCRGRCWPACAGGGRAPRC